MQRNKKKKLCPFFSFSREEFVSIFSLAKVKKMEILEVWVFLQERFNDEEVPMVAVVVEKDELGVDGEEEWEEEDEMEKIRTDEIEVRSKQIFE